MMGQAILSGLGSLGNYVGSLFNNAAPGFALSGMTTPYQRVSPNMDVTKIDPKNMTARNVGEALGMNNNPSRTLDDVQNQFDYGPSVVRHPGYSGYDITQMMIGQDPEFMSRIYYGQEADRLAGGGTENTLAAMQYIMDRNKAREAERFAKYGNPAPGSKFANPNLRNQEPTYASRQDYDQPQITDVDVFGSLF